jgi:hypothetical protein
VLPFIINESFKNVLFHSLFNAIKIFEIWSKAALEINMSHTIEALKVKHIMKYGMTETVMRYHGLLSPSNPICLKRPAN